MCYKLLVLLAFSPQLTFAYSQNSSKPIRIKLEQHLIGKNVLIQKQLKRMENFENAARSWSMYDSKLLEAPYQNDYILAELFLGTPKQGPFKVMVSSGQTRLWVLGKWYNKLAGEQRFYRPEDSSTSSNLHKRLFTIDGSYNISAQWFTDRIVFGDTEVANQAFGVTDQIDERNDDGNFPVDGVLGINHLISSAYGDGKEPPSLIDNLLEQFDTKTVSIYLEGYLPPSFGLSKGSLVIGGFDEQNCDKNELIFNGNFEQNSWARDSRFTMRVNGFQYDSYSNRAGGQAFFDNGISTLQFPITDLLGMYDIILPEYNWDFGFYTVSCKSTAYLPAILVQLDGKFVKIQPQNYIIDMELSNGRCVLPLELLNTENYQSATYVFGTPFFRRRCLVWDMDANTLSGYDPKN